MVDYERMGQVMTERHWVAWVNPKGVWSVGYEKDGGMAVMGMGRSFEEAYGVAERTYNGRSDDSPDPKAS